MSIKTRTSGIMVDINVEPAAGAYVGPGDIYGTTTMGWWGLRAFNAAYATGLNNALRLDNATSTDPVDIKILANGALDVATAAPLIATHKISILYDQSGNGEDLIQTTDAQRPSLNLTGILSININVTAATMFLASSVKAITQPAVISTVVKRSDLNNNNQFFICDNTGAVQARINAAGGNQFGNLFTTAGNYSSSNSFSPGTTVAFQGLFNEAASKIYVDGTNTDGSVGAGVSGTGGFLLGVVGVTVTFDVSEIGWWPSDVSANFSAVNTQQHTYWGF